MVVIETVRGNVHHDLHLATAYREAQAAGHVDEVRLTPLEAQKGRLRVTSIHGTPFGLSLGRGAVVCDGDILYQDDSGSMVVARIMPEEVLVITVRPQASPADLLRVAAHLGHVLGNQHWPFTVEGSSVYVPVSVDKTVMDTVLRTHGLEGVEYHFEECAVGPIPRTIPHAHPHVHAH
jgi:urease accessory protein